MTQDILLDLRGLKCPLPALRTRRALEKLPPGQRLRVECTDPMTIIDIPHLVAQAGSHLDEHHQQNGVFVFIIRKS
ncbi:MAG TPA: sulfurtransferase TusA family protein [Xanthobacteraceae bacterium]|nr:sulfurtransferase TusA family protein [Xanthobacteraceae bacterium]